MSTGVTVIAAGTKSGPMARDGIDQDILTLLRQSNRPLRFREIVEALSARGITKSQVHNAIYRLGKRGHLVGSGSGSSMSYAAAAGEV